MQHSAMQSCRVTFCIFGIECWEMCQWAHDQHFQMHQSGGSEAQTWIGRQPPLLQVRNDSTPTEFHFKHKSAS